MESDHLALITASAGHKLMEGVVKWQEVHWWDKNRVIQLHNNHRGPIKSITAFTANVFSHRLGNFLFYNHWKPILLRQSGELVGAENEISHEGCDIL